MTVENNIARNQYIATAGQTVFTYDFEISDTANINVYQRAEDSDPDDSADLLIYLTDYTLTGVGTEDGGTVILNSGADLNDIITIQSAVPAERTTSFTPNGLIRAEDLNEEFDNQTLIQQKIQTIVEELTPKYPNSALVNDNNLYPTRDTVLPLLGANQFWAMDPTQSQIVAVDIGEIISGGTVTQVNTGTGLTGGPITGAGTISFDSIAANSFWANTTGGVAVPSVTSLSLFLLAANNLSDVPNKATARTNLGLQIGVNVQAYSAALTSIAGLTTAANNLIYTTSSNTYAVISPSVSSVLISSAGGVPSWGQTLPSAVQDNITHLGAQTSALDMNSNLINNVTDPVSAQDAATKSYVDTAGGAYLPLAGGTMSGIINMNTHKITNLTTPTVAADAANKAYVDSTVGSYLPLIGGTMSGVIDMGNHKITNLTDPSASQDAVNLQYLNSTLGNYLALSGGTMTGVINMGSHKITSVTDPTNPQDAATKNYVDTVATGFTVKQACSVATTANLTATYANGASGIGATLTNSGALAALSIDGVSVSTNDRVLVKNQSSTLENGIYIVTNAGSGAVAWILTRTTDFDQPAEIPKGALVIINNGTTNAGTSWIQTDTVSAVGTDPIEFSQFTFSATAVLLKANNLSDVSNTTTAFNNISPLTTKGDLIAYSSQNVRLGVATGDGKILQVSSGAATGLAWSSATYPSTTTQNRILYSSATNTVDEISTLAGGVLVTDSSNVPQFLTNPSAASRILQSGNAAIPSWSTAAYPSVATSTGSFIYANGTNFVASTSLWPNTVGTSGKVVISDGTSNVYSTPKFPNASATAGKIIQSDGTDWVASTPTFPSSASSTGSFIYANGTNFVASTSLWPNTVGSAGKIIRSDGTTNAYTTATYPDTITASTILYGSSSNVVGAISATARGVLVSDNSSVPSMLASASTTGQILRGSTTGAPAWSTATFPATGGASGNILISDGTNYIASTSLWPNTVGTSGKVVISNGTSNVYSTPKFPNASATAGKIIQSDGTDWVASTLTFPTADGSANAALVTNGSGAVSFGSVITSNTYTPTLTNTANISASTSAVFQYLRVGNVVTVSGAILVTPTAAGAITLGLSLPIASNLANSTECAGQFGVPAANGYAAGNITGDTTNDRAICVGIAGDTTQRTWAVHFTYQII